MFRWIRRMSIAFVLSLPLIVWSQQASLYSLPNQFTPAATSNTIAQTQQGRLVVANRMTNTVSVIDPRTGEIAAETAVPSPNSVALTADSNTILVASQAGALVLLDPATLAVTQTVELGGTPHAVVTNNDDVAYVSVQGRHEVVVVDLVNAQIQARIAVPPDPTGMALWGDFLYLTHFWSGDLTLIYAPIAQVVRTIMIDPAASSANGIAVDPAEQVAYLPQSLTNDTLAFATVDNRILPVVQVVDLATLTPLPERRIDLVLADRMVSRPFAIQVSNLRSFIYVAHAGSNDVSVLDRETALAEANFATGANPHGLLQSRDGTRLYVHNAVDSTLTVVDTRFYALEDTIPTSAETIPPDTLIGARLFHSAADTRLSSNRAMNCASCHHAGQSDGRVWNGLNTPVLYDIAQRTTWTWTGRWNTLPDGLQTHIQNVQGGTGLDPNSIDMDALVGYMQAFAPTTSPPTDTAYGQAVFETLSCTTCHAVDGGSDGQTHDVGTGGAFVTPVLIGLERSAPYLHDGAAATLEALFYRGQGTHRLPRVVPDEDVQALLDFLRSL